MRSGRILILVALVAVGGAVPAPGFSQSLSARHDSVEVRESRLVPADVADGIARTFNAPETRRLVGTQSIDSGVVINQDVAAIDGTLDIYGRVTGRVVAINADVVLHPSAHIEKDVVIIGGKLDPRPGAVVVGDLRVYADHMQVDYGPDRIVVHEATAEDQTWFKEPHLRTGPLRHVRFLTTRTYNRVEGLPLLVGPSWAHDVNWMGGRDRVSIEAMGILRSVDEFEWKPSNIGHAVKAEMRLGETHGVRVGGRLFDVVDAVEPWQLSDAEVGLASFFLHRDFRDYYNRHGASMYAGYFIGANADVTLTYSDQRWDSRSTRDPFTLFRDTQTWRREPLMDAGVFHLLDATLRYDSRNDLRAPRSGWYLVADYEHGIGAYTNAAPTSLLARSPGATGSAYDRLLLDVRRYDRLSPEGQLSMRVVVGGWTDGGDLPLERRMSVDGPGTLPGFDFRRGQPGTDYLTCSGGVGGLASVAPPTPSDSPMGHPAECERLALGQIEYRGEIHVDPFGLLGRERAERRGWGRGAEWVVFADAGRGWLVGQRAGDLQYPGRLFPNLSTFRTDVGLGFRFDDIGLYVAKAVSNSHMPVNVFVRLRPRI